MVKYKYIWSADKQNRIFVAITLDMSDKTLLHIKIAVIIKFFVDCSFWFGKYCTVDSSTVLKL